MLSKLIREQGIQAVPHGFRSSFRDPDLAEAILDGILERGRIVTLEGPSMRTRHLDPVPGLSDQETAS